MKILVIDNYDSFTYNLVQLLGLFTSDISIYRNDEITAKGITELSPDRILISPGPGKPEDSGVSLVAIQEFGKSIPILGVCLGHQAIGLSFGGDVVKADSLMHGKSSGILHDGKKLFKSVDQNFVAARYHSLVIKRESLPPVLEITAETKDGVIMGVRHKNFPIEGLQFHPESVLTREGKKLIENWMNYEK
ncbi:MAG: aminodeoxychorismate/anthranilate synthase component II [Ignavibacteria bacterium]|nr:aminodeoxychorismate/anthranilate synthase component II [Ignavibacteria bacterium]